MQQHTTDRRRQAAVRRKTKTKRTTTSFTQDKFRARHKMTSCRKQRSAVINKHQEWHATSKKQRRTHAMSDRFFAQSPALLMVSKFAGEQHAIQKVLNTHTYAREYSPAHSCVCGMAWHIYIHTHTHTSRGILPSSFVCGVAWQTHTHKPGKTPQLVRVCWRG